MQTVRETEKKRNMMRVTATILCGLMACCAAGQNLTDLSVMDDRQAVASEPVNISDVPSIPDSVFLHPDRIRYDHRCFTIDGEDVFLFSGAFHYFRVPRPLWPDRFRKLKAAGFNCVETYVPWNWHERGMPRSLADESCIDLRPLEAFLDMAEEYGLYVIVRPGPYICAEWSGGGYPQWLMRKRPAHTLHEVWLQSNDPEYLRWTGHWLKAVCRVVAPRQHTRRPSGGKGVILFQIENEYNRVKWFARDDKREVLENMAGLVRQEGIDVPLITCWTDEARNVSEGPLNGILDMVNSYPRWEVERNFGRLIDRQMRTQPGKPLMAGELQGGWMSDVGGELSWNQDGLMPVQTQNITLYALQRGFCAVNYYMAVGGTNGDDWGARQMTTTYDYAAAIGEDGSTNDRYRRLQGLGALVREHGTRIARADAVSLEYTTTDPDVRLALRRAANGDRYYFVRTEEHTRHHFGTLQTADFALDFSLEPFGSMVYYLPAGKQDGKWYPEVPLPGPRPVAKSDTVRLTDCAVSFADPLPGKWKRLKRGEHLDDQGIYGRHLVYYRTYAPQGALLQVCITGEKMMNNTDGDGVLLAVDGKLVKSLRQEADSIWFQLPQNPSAKGKQEVLLLYESPGLQHHTNLAVERHWKIGFDYVRCGGKELPLEYAYTEEQHGQALSQGQALTERKTDGCNPFIRWYTYAFTLPQQADNALYHLQLEHTGNGFIYVNGHCIGRCWQKGPQTSYYIPECWLNKEGENRIAISLRPMNDGAEVKKAKIHVKWRHG